MQYSWPYSHPRVLNPLGISLADSTIAAETFIICPQYSERWILACILLPLAVTNSFVEIKNTAEKKDLFASGYRGSVQCIIETL